MKSLKFIALNYLSDSIEKFINKKRLQRFNERVIYTKPIVVATLPTTSGNNKDNREVNSNTNTSNEVNKYKRVDLLDNYPLYKIIVRVLL